jgi:mannose-6-phosphate isomerase-like protein (cupin superfamily)
MRSEHHPEHDPVVYDQLEIVDLAIESRMDAGTYRNIVLNQVNDSCVRLAVFENEYGWHSHPSSDEAFLVLDGVLEIDIEGGATLRLTPMQLVTIPAGTIHRTRAVGRTVNLTFEHLRADTIFV